METRKQKEIEHYDRKAQDFSGQGDFEDFSLFLLKSFQFLKDFLKDKCQGKLILDYGCGNGIHSIWLAKEGGRVIGIDLSKDSLRIARERAVVEGVADRIEFLLMDCENLKFKDEAFDIIFNRETFSSLDLERVYQETFRVLKPDGFLIGIEALGHNPLANLKRMINKFLGRRTGWAISHILKLKDLERAKKYFNKQEVYYFHLFSILAIPFLKLPGGKFLLNFLEKIDKVLLSLPFLKKFAFKVIFILKNEKIV